MVATIGFIVSLCFAAHFNLLKIENIVNAPYETLFLLFLSFFPMFSLYYLNGMRNKGKLFTSTGVMVIMAVIFIIGICGLITSNQNFGWGTEIIAYSVYIFVPIMLSMIISGATLDDKQFNGFGEVDKGLSETDSKVEKVIQGLKKSEQHLEEIRGKMEELRQTLNNDDVAWKEVSKDIEMQTAFFKSVGQLEKAERKFKKAFVKVERAEQSVEIEMKKIMRQLGSLNTVNEQLNKLKTQYNTSKNP